MLSRSTRCLKGAIINAPKYVRCFAKRPGIPITEMSTKGLPEVPTGGVPSHVTLNIATPEETLAQDVEVLLSFR